MGIPMIRTQVVHIRRGIGTATRFNDPAIVRRHFFMRGIAFWTCGFEYAIQNTRRNGPIWARVPQLSIRYGFRLITFELLDFDGLAVFSELPVFVRLPAFG